MQLKPLCRLDLHYDGDFHLVRPYGNESGTGWGRGGGSVIGDRLRGDFTWSNHPRRRGDGVMLPVVRGVVTTDDDAELILELTGRTRFGDDGVGHLMMFALFESEHPAYAWLNDVVCLAEGRLDHALRSTVVVWVCEPEAAEPEAND